MIQNGTKKAPWRVEVERTRDLAKKYRKVIGDTFRSSGEEYDDTVRVESASGEGAEDDEDYEGVERKKGGRNKKDRRTSPGGGLSGAIKKRAVSAKSHIFRKGKIESKYVYDAHSFIIYTRFSLNRICRKYLMFYGLNYIQLYHYHVLHNVFSNIFLFDSMDSILEITSHN